MPFTSTLERVPPGSPVMAGFCLAIAALGLLAAFLAAVAVPAATPARTPVTTTVGGLGGMSPSAPVALPAMPIAAATPAGVEPRWIAAAAPADRPSLAATADRPSRAAGTGAHTEALGVLAPAAGLGAAGLVISSFGRRRTAARR